MPHVFLLGNYTHQFRVGVPSATSNLWRNTDLSAKAAITRTSLLTNDVGLNADAPDAFRPHDEIFSQEVTTPFQQYYNRKMSNLSCDAPVIVNVISGRFQ